jgi:plastocyanin
MRPPLFALALAALLVGASACGSSSSSSSSSPNSSPSSAAGTPAITTSGAATSPGTSTGGATATAPPVTSTLTLAADPGGELKFDKTKLTAKTGRITIAMTNKSAVPHDIAIEGEGLTEQGPVVSNGGVSKLTVFLQPGTYTFFCNIDDHEAGGMKGTLTVQ